MDKKQLTYIASILLIDNSDIVHMKCPPGWGEQDWQDMLRKPYNERVELSISFLTRYLEIED